MWLQHSGPAPAPITHHTATFSQSLLPASPPSPLGSKSGTWRKSIWLEASRTGGQRRGLEGGGESWVSDMAMGGVAQVWVQGRDPVKVCSQQVASPSQGLRSHLDQATGPQCPCWPRTGKCPLTALLPLTPVGPPHCSAHGCVQTIPPGGSEQVDKGGVGRGERDRLSPEAGGPTL